MKCGCDCHELGRPPEDHCGKCNPIRRIRRRDGERELKVRVPVELGERLRVAAEERVVSQNLLVVKAIEFYLERLVPVDEFTSRATSP